MAVAVAATGCGSTAPPSAGQRLERADLVYLAHALQRLRGPVRQEVTAARASWPALNGGLPAPVPAALAHDIATAERRADALVLAPLLTDEHGLTGPPAGVGGLVRSYVLLVQRGWQFLAAAGGAGRTAGGAGFLRANAPLYIYCVYDGHYSLSVVGRELLGAYEKLGGRRAFGGALTPGEVAALLRAYSIPGMRLQPHPPARLKL